MVSRSESAWEQQLQRGMTISQSPVGSASMAAFAEARTGSALTHEGRDGRQGVVTMGCYPGMLPHNGLVGAIPSSMLVARTYGDMGQGLVDPTRIQLAEMGPMAGMAGAAYYLIPPPQQLQQRPEGGKRRGSPVDRHLGEGRGTGATGSSLNESATGGSTTTLHGKDSFAGEYMDIQSRALTSDSSGCDITRMQHRPEEANVPSATSSMPPPRFRQGYEARKMTAEEKLERNREQNRESSRKARERRRVQELSLKEQIQQIQLFRVMVEEGPDMMSIHGMDHRAPFRYASTAFKRLVGINPRDIIGKGLADIIWEGDCDIVHQALLRVLFGHKGGSMLRFHLRTPAGKYVAAESSLRPGNQCIVCVTRLGGEVTIPPPKSLLHQPEGEQETTPMETEQEGLAASTESTKTDQTSAATAVAATATGVGTTGPGGVAGAAGTRGCGRDRDGGTPMAELADRSVL